jgi:hypothetical protein
MNKDLNKHNASLISCSSYSYDTSHEADTTL